MNIQSTAIKPQSTSLTIKVPKVEPDTITDGIWGAADSVVLGVKKVIDTGSKIRKNIAPITKRVGQFGATSLMGAAPGFGLLLACLNRGAYADGRMSSTPLARLNNAGLAAAQMAGLASVGLSIASALTGVGSPGALMKISGYCFGTAAVLGVANATHTNPFAA